jgi:fibronectin type 3 domain-containing protein
LRVFACCFASAILVPWFSGCAGDRDGVSTAQSAVTATPAFVQVGGALPQTPQANVAATFNAAQTSGNLIVAIVGWNDTTAAVTSISDSKGNVYQLAIGPTQRPGALSQSIYYAKNIAAAAAGGNTVTVVFSQPAVYVDLRVLEYSGIDRNAPLDVAVGGNGNNGTSSSGAVTTTNANDLLVAGNMVWTGTTGAGSGYTSRIITSPDGDLAEDRVVTAAGAQTATAPLSFPDNWVMQLAAFKAAVIGGDTTAPTAPGSLTATAASSSQINLAWTAATDDTAVTGYLIERCQGAGCSNFAQVGTATATSFNDGGLTPSTSYSYRVRATDAAANLGPYAGTASATTNAFVDTQPPSAPASLTATVASSTQINLAWTASTDNVGVTGYIIERCEGAGCSGFAQIGTSAATSYADMGLPTGDTFSYRVRAIDAAANQSANSNTATASTPFVDTQPPAAPGGLTATAASSSQIDLAWTAATDNVGVTQYRIERCTGAGCSNFAQIGTATGLSFSDSGLAQTTSYSYRVRAADAAVNLGPYSNTASATTSAFVDMQPPTAPASLTATVASATQINLAWTAATDNVGVTGYLVERCDGIGCSSFSQVGTATLLSFVDAGLAVGTSYSYRVRATDGAGNQSADSNTATAATPTPDTTPPTAPANLTATAGSASQIALAWTAATDNVGVTQYRVERCQGAGCSTFAQVGTSAAASFGDNGLVSGTSYSYRVRATDAAGNLGPYSGTASATTQVNTAPPAFVQGNSAVPQTAQTSVSVAFTAAQAAGDFNVVLVAWTDTTAAVGTVTDSAGNTYQKAIGPTGLTGRLSQSIYYAGNINAAATNTVTVTFSPAAPFVDVRILQYHNVSGTGSVDVSAGASGTTATATAPAIATTNAVDLLVAGAVVETGVTGAGSGFTSRIVTSPDGDNAEDRVVSATGSYTATAPLSFQGGWVMQVVAFRGAGSAPPPADTTPPGAPASLAATAASSSQINLTWTAATDNVGVTNYLIERCQGAGCSSFAQVGTSTATSFNDVGLTGATSYSYRVRATDAAANLGAYSNTASATTSAPLDTQAPTAPSALTAALGGSNEIDLTWGAATDNVAVTGYLVERCAGVGCGNFAQIATSGGTAFADTGLGGSTSFSYRVRATDAAGNLGPYSNVAAAGTGDVQPPTAPANLTATAVSFSQINLTWTAATDDTGVTNYLIERCQGTGCTTFAPYTTTTATAFNDTGLPEWTFFNYRVRATDAAGNLGAYSNVSGVRTPWSDNTPPSAPGALSATAISTSQINLVWTAATDDTAVTGYRVERCQGASCTAFAEVGTSASTTFGDTGLASGTVYNYRVRANDRAGNLGPYTNVAAATTQVNSSPPNFVQGTYKCPQAPSTSVTVPFTAAQAAGDLNVVIVGWNDGTALVGTVTDTAGNTYQLAIGPTVLPGRVSQSIYYAANIKAAVSNSVTVTFNVGAAFPDIRILQYHNVDPSNPVDVVAGGTGTTATTSTPNVATTNAMDLLVTGNLVETGVTAAGSGFTSRIITDPDGDMAADRVVTTVGTYGASSSLLFAGGWVMQMVGFRAAGSAPPPNDTTPPVVSVNAPAAGSNLSGTVTVTIAASDPSGVAGVQLLVDGTVVGTPDTVPPYQFTFDATPYAAGSHTIGATASDTVGNVGGAPPVTVTFVSTSPDQIGSFSGTQSMPMISVNAALLPNGNVMMYDGQPSFAAINAKVWNPTTNVFTAVPAPSDIFCTGIEQMADGRIMVVGGHNGGAHLGMKNTNVFNPATTAWELEPDMNNPRWYPTLTQLHNGKMFVIGGESTCNGCNVGISELYDPSNDLWTSLTQAQMAPPTYPHTFELPDGRIFVSSAGRLPMVSQVLDLTTNTWTAVGGPQVAGGSAAQYGTTKFIKAGSSADPDIAVSPSVATTYVIDMSLPSPTWRQVASMNYARAYHTLTLLPDGAVLVTGGGPDSTAAGIANAVLPAEIWSPDTETWRIVASMHAPRLYHSIALLMPDGRVWISGGGRIDDLTAPTDQFNNEFYSPPYLFKGARPTITAAPATLQYGQPFTVLTPDAASIAKVTLMRFGAVTHTFNTGQRFIPVSFTASSGALTVTAPPNNQAAPGNYMLFIINTNGVPSVAAITHF